MLEQVFSTYWPQFETDFLRVVKTTESAEPSKPRPKDDVLGEILENTRILNSRIRRLELEGDRSYTSSSPLSDSELSVMSQRNIRMRIRAAVREGMPQEIMQTLFHERYPRHLVDTVIQEEIMREKSLSSS